MSAAAQDTVSESAVQESAVQESRDGGLPANAPETPLWNVTLLGAFAFYHRDETVPTAINFPTTKTQLVLAYLLLHPLQTHRRELLSTLLWPESGPDNARRSLRDALLALRRGLREDDPSTSLFLGDRSILHLAPGVFTTDVARFLAALQNAETAPTAAMRTAALEQAVAFYTGPLLPGLYDVEGGEEWLEPKRREFAFAFDTALVTLSTLYAQQGDFDRALLYARRAADNDPEDETRPALVEALRQRKKEITQERFTRAIENGAGERGSESPLQKEAEPAVSGPHVSPIPLPPAAPFIPPDSRKKERFRPPLRVRWAVSAMLAALVAGSVIALTASRYLTPPQPHVTDITPLYRPETYLHSAQRAMDDHHYEQALGHLIKAKMLARTSADRWELAQNFRRLAVAAHQNDQGQGLIALTACQEALDLLRQSERPGFVTVSAMFDTLLQMADAAVLRGDRATALRCVAEAEETVPDLATMVRAGTVPERELSQANCWFRLLEESNSLGEYRKARLYSERCHSLLQKRNSPEHQELRAFWVREVGVTASATGRYTEAETAFKESAAQLARIKDWRTRAAVLGLLGDVYTRTGRHDMALPLYREGLTVWEGAKHRYWTAVFKARIARHFYFKEDFAAAERLARESLALLEESNGPVGRILPLTLLAWASERKGERVASLSYFNQALALARQWGNPRAVAEALEAVAYIEIWPEPSEAGRQHLKEAAALRRQAGTPLAPVERENVYFLYRYAGIKPPDL